MHFFIVTIIFISGFVYAKDKGHPSDTKSIHCGSEGIRKTDQGIVYNYYLPISRFSKKRKEHTATCEIASKYRWSGPANNQTLDKSIGELVAGTDLARNNFDNGVICLKKATDKNFSEFVYVDYTNVGTLKREEVARYKFKIDNKTGQVAVDSKTKAFAVKKDVCSLGPNGASQNTNEGSSQSHSSGCEGSGDCGGGSGDN